MNQVYRDANAAMHAAYALSKRLHKPLWRLQGVDSRGAPAWVISLEKDAAIALGGVSSPAPYSNLYSAIQLDKTG